MATYLLGLAAAVCFGVAAVIQQRVAFTAPPGDVLRLRLLLWLVRRPLWDLGVAIGGLGSLLAAAALTHGAVALVEPLQICQLLFALPLAALLARRVVPRRDWLAAAATAAGLAVFVAAGAPDSGQADHATTAGWVTTGVLVALMVFAATWGTRRFTAVRRAPLLAGAAGVLSALQAALVSGAGHLLTTSGLGGLTRSWFPLAIVAVALISAVLAQSAYEMAPLPASLPASVSTEPLVGVAIGVGLLGGGLRLTPLAIVAEVIGLAVMTVGVRTLARSPLITGQLSRLAARQAQGRLSRSEEQVHHDLERLRHDLRHSRRTGPNSPATRRLRKRLGRDLDRIGAELASLADERDRFELQLRPTPTPTPAAPPPRPAGRRRSSPRAGRPLDASAGAVRHRSRNVTSTADAMIGASAADATATAGGSGSGEGRAGAAGTAARSRRGPVRARAAVPVAVGECAAAPAARPAGRRTRTLLGDDLVPVDGLHAARRELDARAEDLRRQAERLRRATRRVLAAPDSVV